MESCNRRDRYIGQKIKRFVGAHLELDENINKLQRNLLFILLSLSIPKS